MMEADICDGKVTRGDLSPERPLGAACLAWIDSTLLRYHDENPLTSGDHPGFSRDAATVRRLLSPVIATDSQGAAPGTTRDDDEGALLEAFERADAREPLVILRQVLSLSPRELGALLLCLAPDLDPKYQTVCGRHFDAPQPSIAYRKRRSRWHASSVSNPQRQQLSGPRSIPESFILPPCPEKKTKLFP